MAYKLHPIVDAEKIAHQVDTTIDLVGAAMNLITPP